MDRLISFSDGTSLTVSDYQMQSATQSVETALRTIRRAVLFREGEVRLGLARKHYLPIMWLMTQQDGVAEMAPSFWFMGAEIFLTSEFRESQ